jgi:hypothetical protein
LRNTFSKLSVTERAALHAMIERIQRCKGTNSCWAAELPSEAAEQG